MKLLDEIADQFGTSSPVFEAIINNDNQWVEFRLKTVYKPNIKMIVDPVAKVVAQHYQEKIEGRKIVQCTDTDGAYRDIMEELADFYKNYSPLKNPKQSTLYKWLSRMEREYNHPAAEGFIKLYRYLHDDRSPTTSERTANNILAILELMREKYDEGDDKNSHQ
jgi:hypothetical protein